MAKEHKEAHNAATFSKKTVTKLLKTLDITDLYKKEADEVKVIHTAILELRSVFEATGTPLPAELNLASVFGSIEIV